MGVKVSKIRSKINILTYWVYTSQILYDFYQLFQYISTVEIYINSEFLWENR